MRWLEIIEFNSGAGKPKFIERDLESLIKKLNAEEDQKVFKVYSRVTAENDFSIHLYQKSKNIKKIGSPLGISLSSALRNFGLVKHNVWV